MACPAVNDQVSCQLETGPPRLSTATSAPNPPGHELVILYWTRHPVAACATVAVSAPAKATGTVTAAAITPASQGRRRLIFMIAPEVRSYRMGARMLAQLYMQIKQAVKTFRESS